MKHKRLHLDKQTIRTLTDLSVVHGAERQTDTKGMCGRSRGFSYCYTICINGSGCGTD